MAVLVVTGPRMMTRIGVGARAEWHSPDLSGTSGSEGRASGGVARIGPDGVGRAIFAVIDESGVAGSPTRAHGPSVPSEAASPPDDEWTEELWDRQHTSEAVVGFEQDELDAGLVRRWLARSGIDDVTVIDAPGCMVAIDGRVIDHHAVGEAIDEVLRGRAAPFRWRQVAPHDSRRLFVRVAAPRPDPG